MKRIRNRAGERVAKDRRTVLERHAMLGEIRFRLLWVPLELYALILRPIPALGSSTSTFTNSRQRVTSLPGRRTVGSSLALPVVTCRRAASSRRVSFGQSNSARYPSRFHAAPDAAGWLGRLRPCAAPFEIQNGRCIMWIRGGHFFFVAVCSDRLAIFVSCAARTPACTRGTLRRRGVGDADALTVRTGIICPGCPPCGPGSRTTSTTSRSAPSACAAASSCSSFDPCLTSSSRSICGR
jgi:hypothetical protein